MTTISEKTEILIEALPYIRRYGGSTFVIKYGGAAMVDNDLEDAFARDVTLLKTVGIRIVIVHGGGKEVTQMADKLGLHTRFIQGQRYTDSEMMEVVQMVLAGKTNKDIVSRINLHEGNAVGVCGIDAKLLTVRKYSPGETDLGFVGEITGVNTAYLAGMLDQNILPVIAPVGVDRSGQTYNINADVAASRVAAALRAEKLVYLSDVKGVMIDHHLVHSIEQQEAERLIRDRIITDGMIPKIQSAFHALDAGVGKVHMIDGRVKHSLLLEIFTDAGVGTELIHSSLQTANPPLQSSERFQN